MFYFAYGSCMNEEDFHRTMIKKGRVLPYRKIGKACLDHYKLAYNAYSYVRQGGVLDIEPYKGKQVIGILYELSREALEQVDKREGSQYKRIIVDVQIGTTKLQAYTYVIRKKQSTEASIKYSGIVYHAMLEHSFPTEYINEFVSLVRVSAYGSEEKYFKYKEKKKELMNGSYR